MKCIASSFCEIPMRRRFTSVLMGTMALGCALFFAAPAQAQLSHGTAFQNIDIGINYATVSTTEIGGISGPGSLAAGITLPAQLGPDSPLFSFVANPNAIYQNAIDLNKALASLFPKENVVDVVAYNNVVNAYNGLQQQLLLALTAADALPVNTPEEALRKKNALDAIEALVSEMERIAPRLSTLGQAIRAAV